MTPDLESVLTAMRHQYYNTNEEWAEATIQAYKETKAFRLAAIEYVIGMEWFIDYTSTEEIHETRKGIEKVQIMLKQMAQEEIENEN